MEKKLERFKDPQDRMYDIALIEIKRGLKQSHWMWYIFPQIKGLGETSTSEYYAIQNKEEALEFLQHPVFGKRLIEISQALLQVKNRTAFQIFGSPDYLKLKSSMTLFKTVAEENSVFEQVLTKYYNGEEDRLTLLFLE